MQLLTKAAKLYECGCNLMVQKECGLWRTSSSYILACLNNMGLIYQSLKKPDTSLACFEHLLGTLIFLNQSNRQSSTDLDGYLEIVCTNLYHAASPAAAA